MNELYIKIEYSDCNEGYMVDLYTSEDAIENGEDSIDGGLCENDSIIEAARFAVSILEDYQKIQGANHS